MQKDLTDLIAATHTLNEALDEALAYKNWGVQANVCPILRVAYQRTRQTKFVFVLSVRAWSNIIFA